MLLLATTLACTAPSDTHNKAQQAYQSDSPPWTTAVGSERFIYSSPATDPSHLECDMTWSITGNPIPADCDGCVLAFETQLRLDRTTSFSNNEECDFLLEDRTERWAFTTSDPDTGDALLFQHPDVGWTWWAWAELEDDELSWWFGWYE